LEQKCQSSPAGFPFLSKTKRRKREKESKKNKEQKQEGEGEEVRRLNNSNTKTTRKTKPKIRANILQEVDKKCYNSKNIFNKPRELPPRN